MTSVRSVTVSSGLSIDRVSGLINEARQVPSPNCDDRPEDAAIDLVVVHSISLPPAEFGGPWIDALFTNTLDPQLHPYFREIHRMRVSSHLLIRRDGELVQYVPLHRRAWHAGASCFAGRERCNDFSIGIELEGTDEDPYEVAQYQRLAAVIAVLEKVYPEVTRDRLAGHSDIAPGRKTDPGSAFEWARLEHELERIA
ncbi:1,6-anhydro-N-acetylmuramyl-L-alanine amidase AmpD [Thiohalomonas denitrificans]|uniref:1,6-anhydro-N-acetylmuramyl-L-alanine amidase AmpD n=1 Tax=Thiohalomonas denitrificans TaxID=415747 RepID=A0A1G5Q671_9GAMM|nr:1,6-anhydro-N-acetylmuramyl-L-alanine amidase AmpD [Thiohalomonas denitrificans]SCZ57385.1 AmpD protein [Thiohalomonas denitrificans]